MTPNQAPARFTRDEAQEKLGRRVRSVVSLDEIPAGTCGTVMQTDEIEQGEFELIIEWDARPANKLQADWFTKEQYEAYLIEETRVLDD
jgi:hypothetical protein